MDTDSHILNAACNLLGISLLIITGLHISNHSGQSFADEIAGLSAACFSASCLLSYLSIRSTKQNRLEAMADKVFLLGLCSILASVVVLVMSGTN